MQAPEPLPELLAETESAPADATAAVVAAPIAAPQRRIRRSPQAEVPAVPLPSAPVEHLSFEGDDAAAQQRESAQDAPAVAVAQAVVADQAVEPSTLTAPIAVAAEPVAEAIEAAASTAPAEEPVDLFVEAARALNFTGETPLASDEPRPVQDAAPRTGSHHTARRKRPTVRRVATVAASISAFGVVGLLAVGMTTPFSALATTDAAAAAGVSIAAGTPAAATADDEQIQAFVAPADAQNAQIERTSKYETTTFAEIAAVTGINTANAVYVNDPTADIQWPIVLGTSMSSAFGQRWGRLHEGIDFTPGNGAPIQAIADGTVRIGPYGAYGNNVYIDHVIDGQMITSHYAHMQDGSVRVTNGQHVEVGDVIGLVGNTGRSYGAHLHFELRLPSGTAIDPMPWLKEHANTHYRNDEPETAGE